MTNYEIIKQACIKANPKKDFSKSKITLCDILFTISRKGYGITPFGDFIEIISGGKWKFPDSSLYPEWNFLKDELKYQHKETKQFLAELLRNE